MPADEGGKEEAPGKRGRGNAFRFPELMCCMYAALGTNEKFSAGKCSAVRLQHYNDAYTQRVKWMKEHDKWRDQHGNLVSDVSPEDSIQTRVKTVTTSTKDTPISYQVARVVGVCRNHIAPLLQKIVDKDGKIPTGKQVSDIREALRTAYFESLTGDNPAEAFTSEDEGSKAERVETAANARAQKLDKFHPMDLYLYFHFGPASVGGSGSPYFLETAEAIQKAVKEAAISNRSELRKKNEEDLDQEAKTKKRKHGKPLLVNSVEEMDEITASSSSSFGAEYQKQLQLETIRVETERSRERRESLQFQIKMLEDLILHLSTVILLHTSTLALHVLYEYLSSCNLLQTIITNTTSCAHCVRVRNPIFQHASTQKLGTTRKCASTPHAPQHPLARRVSFCGSSRTPPSRSR